MAEQAARQTGSARVPVVPVLMVILGAFMAMLDSSIVNISIPKMEAVFGANTTEIQWVVTAYSLMLGIIVPLTGYLPGRFGTKKVYLTALILFTIGSALCGMAWSTFSMIAFRVLQAVGGGMLMPVGMSLLLRLFPLERRGAAMGMVGMAMIVAPAIGPTLGGYITDYLDWRLIFYINVPIGILTIFLIITSLRLPEGHDGARVKFDVWGFITSTIGFFSLLYAFSEAPSKGWSSPLVWSFLVFGIAVVCLFIVIELRSKQPMMNLHLFRDYNFSLAVVAGTVLMTALFSGMFFIPVFEQNIVGLSALNTGLMLMPSALVSALLVPVSGKLFDKYGGKIMIPLGIAFLSIMTYVLRVVSVDTPANWVMWMLVLRNVGLAFSMMPLNTAGLMDIQPHEMNQASAVTQTARMVGSSIGTAILTTFMSSRNALYYAHEADTLQMGSPAANRVGELAQAFAARGVGPVQAKAAAFSTLIRRMMDLSFAKALDDVFVVTAGLGAVAFVMALFIKGKKPVGAPRNSQVRGEASRAPEGESRTVAVLVD